MSLRLKPMKGRVHGEMGNRAARRETGGDACEFVVHMGGAWIGLADWPIQKIGDEYFSTHKPQIFSGANGNYTMLIFHCNLTKKLLGNLLL